MKILELFLEVKLVINLELLRSAIGDINSAINKVERGGHLGMAHCLRKDKKHLLEFIEAFEDL